MTPDFDWPFFTTPDEAAAEFGCDNEGMPDIELKGFKPKPGPMILPCPFCGKEARVQKFEEDRESGPGPGFPTFRAVCSNERCGATGPEAHDLKDARERWNRRAAPPKTIEIAK